MADKVRKPSSVEILELAARLLGPLCEEVVFVGGVTLPLLINDPDARRPRMTDDADVIVEATTKVEYQAVEQRLRDLGFQHDQFGPICRFLHSGLVLDVMPIEESVLGFLNQWYSLCMTDWKWHLTPGGFKVRVISSPCFLACKLDAFRSPHREGAGDPLASRDFEDIISVLDGCSDLEIQAKQTHPEIRRFLAEQAGQLLSNGQIGFCIECCLDPDPRSQDRLSFVLERMRWLSSLD